ncbi:hypothetical protein RGQ13_18830 [Thalassotalea psychrophila]|uniref:DUF420 domain-containing protein n=1 Tax=Thalassotalea psychrophila TaxID=3065647 RepID=A0ABY9TTM7_9GAMM|nr:hypothetical protein RGQ13_18830 [Colwelliaceae bacterium SQ149]
MFPQGFFGTRADLMMDLVIVAFIIIMPLLVISWRTARSGNHLGHAKMQISLSVILAVAVVIFELDLKLSGGMAVLTKDSTYFGTNTLNYWMWGHTLIAIITTLLWAVLVILSIKKFKLPPNTKTNPFRKFHRPLGYCGMISMFATGLTSFPLYYYGFMM